MLLTVPRQRRHAMAAMLLAGVLVTLASATGRQRRKSREGTGDG